MSSATQAWPYAMVRLFVRLNGGAGRDRPPTGRYTPQSCGSPNAGAGRQPWFLLVSAIALEVAGTTSMKLSQGVTKLGPSVLLSVCYAASFVALTLALKKIEGSVAYAVWAGVGTALLAALGILYFREALSALKLVSLLLIIAGVVGLNLSEAKP